MADDLKREKPTRAKKELDVDDILRRVDSLPVLDPRPADEIMGYDEHGLPTGTKCPDFAAIAKKTIGDRVVEDFLNYRHREWEENFVGARKGAQMQEPGIPSPARKSNQSRSGGFRLYVQQIQL